jgi:hypothetical protein
MMKKLFALLLTLLLVSMLGGTSLAATITAVGTLGPVPTNQNTSIAVDQFDSALGVLQSATFTLEGDLNGEYWFINSDGPNQFGYWAHRGSISISSGSMSLNGELVNPTPWPTTEQWSSSYATIGNPVGPLGSGEQKKGSSITISEDTSYTFNLGSDDLSPYIGSGEVLFSFIANSESRTALTGGNGLQAILTSVTGKITAVYDFTPVPIPGAVWLLASGLVGLVGLRKRFQN